MYTMNHDGITWDAHEYHHFDKTSDWYWSLGIVALTFSIVCIIFGNILFGIFILLSALAAGLYAGRAPEIIHIELRSKGVIFHDKFYHYAHLDSFWVDEEEHPAKVIIKSKKMLVPFIVIPIDHVNPDDVRVYLKMHLKEVEHHESLGHKVLEYFGF